MRFLKSSQEISAKLNALDRSQAVIEFNVDGTIITANPNFLNAMGYRLEEIEGKHHSMFVAPELRESAEYREFWNALRRGEYQAGEYMCIAKGGRPVWIQASYNPLLNSGGKPFKVVKFATDITGQKLKTADYEGQIMAIQKSQAVIEFNLDGTVITANDNFLKTLDTGWTKSRASITACSLSPPIATARNIVNSGICYAVATTRGLNTSGSPRAENRSGFRRPTIRSSGRTESSQRS
jgi:PAS domain S-box-containing protein